MKVTEVRGPWFSLGIHVDVQRWFIEIHFIWWIVTIGRDYYDGRSE